MAKFYLINSVRTGTITHWPGSVVDDTNVNTSKFIAAGAVLWPVGESEIVDAAATKLADVRRSGGSIETAERIMRNAIDELQRSEDASGAVTDDKIAALSGLGAYLRGAGYGGKVWTPRDLGSCVLWLRRRHAIYDGTSRVSAINDWAPGAAAGASAAGVARPTYGATSFSGTPGLTYDGVDTVMSLATGITTAKTIYVALDPNSPPANSVLLGSNVTNFDFGGTGALVFDGNAAASIQNGSLWLNGAKTKTVLNTSMPTGPTIFTVATFGGAVRFDNVSMDRIAGRRMAGIYGDVLAFSVEHTAAQRRAVEDFMLADHGTSLCRQVICDGNSLTAGSGATAGNDYPSVLQALLGSGYLVNNIGIGGQMTPDMAKRGPQYVDDIYGHRADTSIYVAWECTNDSYFGASAVAVYQNYVNACLARREAGFSVVACTYLPRSNGGTPGTFAADRATVNALIRANWRSFADAFADIAGDTRIGDTGDETNLTYYNADLCHMTDAGYAIVAGIVRTAMASL